MNEETPAKDRRPTAKDRIALWVCSHVGTLECAGLFLIIVILPLVFPSTTVTVQFLSSAVLQLVLLPVIMVGQNLLSAKADAHNAAVMAHLTKLVEHLCGEDDTLLERTAGFGDRLDRVEAALSDLSGLVAPLAKIVKADRTPLKGAKKPGGM
jgi:hypothetical protein